MDFIKNLHFSKEKTTLFVIVDRLAKYAHFIPISHPYTAPNIAQVFFDHIFKLHRILEIVYDRPPYSLLSYVSRTTEV